jgi:tetratricopeptide (TPR) repeat protein
MAMKTVRFQPYYLENLEDGRIPDSVIGYAGLLEPGLSLDFTEQDHQVDDSNRRDIIRRTKVGRGKGLNLTLHERRDPPGDTPTEGSSIEVSTFGLAGGRQALIRYQMLWDKGNRSYLELEVEGPDEEAKDIAEAFRKTFAGPTEDDLNQMKKEMQEALMRQEWGSTQDYAQVILLWQPDDTETLQALGSALLISRDVNAAEKVMNRLLELQPDSHAAYLNLGNVWMDRQDYDKAIEHYRKMMELTPGESFGPFIVATAYEAKGDTQEAIALYKQAAELKGSPGPTDFQELAREAIARLGGA